MKNYSVRVATLSDFAGVNALLQASYPILMKPAYDEVLLAPALKLMTRANPALLASGTFYIAEAQDESMVGCGGWTLERPGNDAVEAGLGHIRHFGTHPDWTNLGIGRAIYRLCETDARSARITSFECNASLNAEKFYSALGFESIRRMDCELNSSVMLPGVLMRCKI